MRSRYFILPLTAAFFVPGCRQTTPLDVPPVDVSVIDETAKVWDVLYLLGRESPPHSLTESSSDLVESGRELILRGEAEGLGPGGKLSEYFRCTDCHSTAREDPDLTRIGDPEARLVFVEERDLPLLPGTTFAGIVNRERWYNGEWLERYGYSAEAQEARTDLRKAIELCCRVGARGRTPEPDELRAILAYFWSLQLTLGDLGVVSADVAEWKQRAVDPAEHDRLAEEIRSRYVPRAPATFGKPPEDPKAGFATEKGPNAATGAAVWRRACLHCHDAAGASEHYFGDKIETWDALAKKFTESPSVYDMIRVGSQASEDSPAYMPPFTRERLSDFQIESLRAFIEKRATSPTEDQASR